MISNSEEQTLVVGHDRTTQQLKVLVLLCILELNNWSVKYVDCEIRGIKLRVAESRKIVFNLE